MLWMITLQMIIPPVNHNELSGLIKVIRTLLRVLHHNCNETLKLRTEDNYFSYYPGGWPRLSREKEEILLNNISKNTDMSIGAVVLLVLIFINAIIPDIYIANCPCIFECNSSHQCNTNVRHFYTVMKIFSNVAHFLKVSVQLIV